MSDKLEEALWKELNEIVNDAINCPRLTPWEETFIKDMFQAFVNKGKEINLSDKQIAVIRRIGNQKVYMLS